VFRDGPRCACVFVTTLDTVGVESFLARPADTVGPGTVTRLPKGRAGADGEVTLGGGGDASHLCCEECGVGDDSCVGVEAALLVPKPCSFQLEVRVGVETPTAELCGIGMSFRGQGRGC